MQDNNPFCFFVKRSFIFQRGSFVSGKMKLRFGKEEASFRVKRNFVFVFSRKKMTQGCVELPLKDALTDHSRVY